MGQNEATNIAPLFQRMHYSPGSLVAAGEYESERGKGPINYLFWLLTGVPVEPDPCNFELQISKGKGAEVWSRTFANKVFRTKVITDGIRLTESRGPFRFDFELVAKEGEVLDYQLQSFKIMGIPLPRILRIRPRAICKQLSEDSWSFEVEVVSPFGQRIIRYWGIAKLK